MTCVTREYPDTLGPWKKTNVSLGCFLYKEITRKHFVQLKTIDKMGRKTILSLSYLELIMHLGKRTTSVHQYISTSNKGI